MSCPGVCNSAMLQCSFGLTPAPLMVLPNSRTMVNSMLMANIMDNKPFVNIMPFGLCSSMANPTVVAATAAALGVFTPMPCLPATMAPWVPGSPTVLIGGMPALTAQSKLMCSWSGVIQIVFPGQMTIIVT
ncbi:DUF4280 domain-containing protein [Salmonella enterica subsp. enterica serovar Muenchen]|nr:DUF4280 domain-containing protein [Salmonella enterica subsp. enterica serovar Muenchen]ECZ7909652.1 DUF4280 domain-containing protein [Salmonella enterica subsp. enterica serovar Muenchen]